MICLAGMPLMTTVPLASAVPLVIAARGSQWRIRAACIELHHCCCHWLPQACNAVGATPIYTPCPGTKTRVLVKDLHIR